jgi:UDP-N-acetylmuramoyl-tripeptide--D-alanyl-D-alanine ligase
LKEYHWARFKAHFETQKVKKLLFSFHGIRYPRITKKTVVILFSGLLAEFFILFYLFSFSGYLFYFSLLVSIILLPLIFSLLILFFQIPTTFLKKIILKRAKKKIEKFSKQGRLVIGITGSYGKSSTKEFLAIILSKKFNVLKTEKNINSEIGIAQTVLKKLKPEHQIFIAEIGAYERGKIKEVCQMLRPRIGILTGINEQHLSTFGSQEDIIKAKFELIDSLPEEGTAILNGENKYIKERIKNLYKAELSSYRQELKIKDIKAGEDIWAENIRVEKEFVYFKVFSKKGDSADFKVNLLGRQNIENILLAVACAEELGMSLEEISGECLKINPEQGGIRFLKKENPVILDSSYSANPTGVMADLDYLKIYSGKKIIIMPCLIELGKSAKEIHKKIGKKIGEVCGSAIITTKDYFKEVKEGAIEAGMNEKNILFIKNPDEIVSRIKSCGSNITVLLEGRLPNGLAGLLCDSIS